MCVSIIVQTLALNLLSYCTLTPAQVQLRPLRSFRHGTEEEENAHVGLP
jgi:hypothetical protein